jgi:hypothetical protein
MRLLRLLLTGLFAAFALLAGLFIAAVGVLAFAIARLLGRSNGTRTRVPVRSRPPQKSEGDVIEVTATEVPVDPFPEVSRK